MVKYLIIVLLVGLGFGGCEDGANYVGEFKDGQYHGQGTLTYENGANYVGEFKGGIKQGQGTYTSASGAKLVGEWIKGTIATSTTKYVGSHNGRWEGFLLNQYNQGSASFTVQNNGNAKLSLFGYFNAVHNGKIKGNRFITDKGQSCAIVDQDGGFKIVLIWTGVNADVYF